ncbi:Pentatricopeptide repeat-containing protein [Platanthera zijinensis]|uniref:Pentatricopeptide repeat-containing protein n=1 Tax=Platanthera zijinensis TaxID=2320716 RepID=A0AAP0FZX3_9ASPA
MPERNSVSWNLIKEAYFTSRSFEIALDLFKERVKAGWKQLLPSTLTLVLRICSVSTDLRKGKEIHGCIVRRGNGILLLTSDTSNAACNVDEEHKLPSSTLAFALIRVGDEKIIRIGKNFRVCGDSHELFKFVSSAYEREIAFKDPNQYHRIQSHWNGWYKVLQLFILLENFQLSRRRKAM